MGRRPSPFACAVLTELPRIGSISARIISHPPLFLRYMRRKAMRPQAVGAGQLSDLAPSPRTQSGKGGTSVDSLSERNC